MDEQVKVDGLFIRPKTRSRDRTAGEIWTVTTAYGLTLHCSISPTSSSSAVFTGIYLISSCCNQFLRADVICMGCSEELPVYGSSMSSTELTNLSPFALELLTSWCEYAGVDPLTTVVEAPALGASLKEFFTVAIATALAR